MMPRTQSRRLIAILVLIPLSGRPAPGDLDAAHQLLQQFWQRRMQAKDERSRDLIAREIESVVPRAASLIEQGTLKELNAAQPVSGQGLENELRHVLTVNDTEPQTGSAAVLTSTSSGGALYVVAYGISYCVVCTTSSIDVFGPAGGQYRLLAKAQDPLPNRTVNLSLLRPVTPGGVTFLADGVNWGDPHNRLTVILYSFDGRELKEIWSRRDLPRGQVSSAGGRIVLTFHTAVDTPGRPPSKEKTEIYRLTPEGVKLEAGSEKPG